MTYAASVTDEAAVDMMVGTLLEAWGRINVLVKNADILRQRLREKTIADFRTVMDVHLVGVAN